MTLVTGNERFTLHDSYTVKDFSGEDKTLIVLNIPEGTNLYQVGVDSLPLFLLGSERAHVGRTAPGPLPVNTQGMDPKEVVAKIQKHVEFMKFFDTSFLSLAIKDMGDEDLQQALASTFLDQVRALQALSPSAFQRVSALSHLTYLPTAADGLRGPMATKQKLPENFAVATLEEREILGVTREIDQDAEDATRLILASLWFDPEQCSDQAAIKMADPADPSSRVPLGKLFTKDFDGFGLHLETLGYGFIDLAYQDGRFYPTGGTYAGNHWRFDQVATTEWKTATLQVTPKHRSLYSLLNLPAEDADTSSAEG